jgi:hypothetical protein
MRVPVSGKFVAGVGNFRQQVGPLRAEVADDEERGSDAVVPKYVEIPGGEIRWPVVERERHPPRSDGVPAGIASPPYDD